MPKSDPAKKRTAGACAVVLDDQSRVLLQQRTDNGRWALPGGGIETGERADEACVREVLEVTGYHVEVLHLGHGPFRNAFVRLSFFRRQPRIHPEAARHGRTTLVEQPAHPFPCRLGTDTQRLAGVRKGLPLGVPPDDRFPVARWRFGDHLFEGRDRLRAICWGTPAGHGGRHPLVLSLT